MTITIMHTPGEGTLLLGTARGDGSAEILKRNGWRWGRSITAWYIQSSRDRAPKRRVIDHTAQLLTDAGFDVEVDVDDTFRTAAEAEADRIARQEQRVDALEAKAARKADAAQAAEAAAARAHDALPPMGEPIKVGHHSESRHRAAIARADATMRRSIDADEDARHARDRAEAAGVTTSVRYAPRTVANRIDRLEKELARWQRHRDGSRRTLPGGYVDVTAPAEGAWAERVQRELARVADELKYWRGIRAGQIASGEVVEHSPATIHVGDLIKYSGLWGVVTRTNPKTVTARSEHYGAFKAPYTHIEAHRRPGEEVSP